MERSSAMLSKNAKLTGNARTLRQNMTKEELRLWLGFLKPLPLTVNRQKVICNYIVDFYIGSERLIIELDGSQHYEEAGQESDVHRDQALREKGYTVLRYTNLDIKENFQGVCEDILRHINASPWGEAVERSETDEG